ncbi:LLM class flavin-dependent oxidoreductase [Peribacillus loiseleuriae]|uniref:Alkane 1-monooxygenase n=1 Tax=Peribacillus loiseleuriae TaxID=1679170 RepID=A0A0K9GY53_9BACI|nr:LLM class flavin-dependent oxidoreductase [Peribacillus loiseleuriae]KMY51550.1 alkane 1-monooxygenase [Peribacillus loiseleuriae]
MGYQLGLLDQSPIQKGASPFEALQQTVHLAQKAEEWGYSRFWVSEHHHTEQLAGSSPEVLISYLLARTNAIRIGSGGVMLQHYSSYKVAENFHVLSTLAPGRVDLGIGKGPGGLPLSSKALQFGTVNDGEDFEERLSFLNQLLENSVDENHSLSGIQALPVPPEKPENYLLGASVESAKLAAKYGWNFVFARFINSDISVLEEAANAFHARNERGRLLVSVAVIAAPSKQEAEQLALDHKLFKVHLKSGRTVTVQSAKQAETFGSQAGEPYEVSEQEANIIAGTPVFIKEELAHLHNTYQVDEFILHSPVQTKEERFRTFQLLSPTYSEEKKNEEEYIL